MTFDLKPIADALAERGVQVNSAAVAAANARIQ